MTRKRKYSSKVHRLRRLKFELVFPPRCSLFFDVGGDCMEVRPVFFEELVRVLPPMNEDIPSYLIEFLEELADASNAERGCGEFDGGKLREALGLALLSIDERQLDELLPVLLWLAKTLGDHVKRDTRVLYEIYWP